MLPTTPPAGPGRDGDTLGAEMPIGKGRMAAGRAESSRWKQTPAGCDPTAPPPAAKSRPGDGEHFGPLFCQDLILPAVSFVPPRVCAQARV